MAIQRFPVEAGHVLTFVRAIGDRNATYSDDEFNRTGLDDVVVPPTFVQASAQFDAEYPLRPQPGKRWLTDPSTKAAQPDDSAGTSAAESDAAARGPVLHAEQRYEFVRPVRVGDVFTATQRPGRQWDKQSRSGGRLFFAETVTEFRDQTGELTVTATAVAVRVGQAAAQTGGSK